MQQSIHFVLLLLVLLAGTIESAPFDVRLTGGQQYQGLVEIQVGETWRPVCKDFGDYKTSCDLICKSLDYQSAKGYYDVAVKDLSEGVNALIVVKCTDEESRLSECNTKSSCFDGRQLAVICDNGQDLPNGNIRLSGATPNSGLVERQIHGVWASLCAYGFSNREADVLCRTLGHKGALSYEVSYNDKQALYSPNGDKVYKCKGHESHLRQCEFGVPVESCGVPPRVTCHDNEENIQVRLSGGDVPYAGNLQVKFKNRWGSVCFSWGDTDFICRMLNYTRSIAKVRHYKRGRKKIWLSYFQCPSDATTLGNCFRSERWGQTEYCEDWTMGLICDDPKVNYLPMAVRLIQGDTANQGRVQVRYKGVWGSLTTGTFFCRKWDDCFYNKIDTVLCRMLGYKNAIGELQFALTNSKGPRVLKSIGCQGHETSLEQCLDANDGWVYGGKKEIIIYCVA